MAWVAPNDIGIEEIFLTKPSRKIGDDGECFWSDRYEGFLENTPNTGIGLPKGSIKKLIDRDLTWEDEPVELKEN